MEKNLVMLGIGLLETQNTYQYLHVTAVSNRNEHLLIFLTQNYDYGADNELIKTCFCAAHCI